MKKHFATLGLLLAMSFSVHAFQVEPLIQTLSETGAGANATFRVENTSSTVLELEVEALQRTIQGREEEQLSPADSDFIIMPPMAEIQPGDYQVFRARYLGKEKLTEASSYRIFFRQLPIQDSAEQGNEVKFLFNIGALVFVNPHSGSPSMSAAIEDDHIVLTNSGNAVADLSRYKLSLESSNDSISMPWHRLAQFGSASFLLPTQETTIPLSEWYELETAPNKISISQ